VNGSVLDGAESRCVPLYSPGNCTLQVGTGSRSKSPVDGLVFVAERVFDPEERKSWLEKAEDIDRRGLGTTPHDGLVRYDAV